jgi:hypothetical protein
MAASCWPCEARPVDQTAARRRNLAGVASLPAHHLRGGREKVVHVEALAAEHAHALALHGHSLGHRSHLGPAPPKISREAPIQTRVHTNPPHEIDSLGVESAC